VISTPPQYVPLSIVQSLYVVELMLSLRTRLARQTHARRACTTSREVYCQSSPSVLLTMALYLSCHLSFRLVPFARQAWPRSYRSVTVILQYPTIGRLLWLLPTSYAYCGCIYTFLGLRRRPMGPWAPPGSARPGTAYFVHCLCVVTEG
jgi:hypothetical protein